MKILAKQFNVSEEIWILVGLLHDFDYDIVDDSSSYGLLAAKELQEKLPSEAIYAIQSHDYRAGVKP
jgi:predicted hydrolase (HD superfamily)